MGYFFTVLLRRCLLATPGTQTCRAIPCAQIGSFRCFSSPAAPTSERIDFPFEDYESSSSFAESPDDLRSRIFRLRFPKRSATAVIEKWVAEGRKASSQELRRIAMDLRRSQRFKHALEISEWMKIHQESQLSDNDYAMRIDLITKVFGVSSAEEFFEGLPSSTKSCEAYTALLHSYAGAKLVDKAELLFERIKDSNLSLSILTFNEMMTLYTSIGQFEKVHIVVEELKRRKISPDLFTYNLRISACAATLDIEGVRKILDEMGEDLSSDGRWTTYAKLTDIYITAGHLVSSDNSLVESEEKISQRERITYDFLILLHGGLGNVEKINEIWKALRLTSQKMTSRNYICVLSSYLALGKQKEAGEVIDEWMQSQVLEFDISACNRLYDGFLKIFMWLESQRSFRASAADQAAKLDLIIKVDSLANAELYFEQISNTASQKVASLPLLHFYVKQKELGKAEALLTKLCSLSFIVNPHHFNEIMKLYAATDQFKKVIYVIRHMKRSKVCLNVLSYNLWMNACGEVSDVASLEMIYKEMMVDNNVEVGWSTYCTLANIYTRFGLVDNAFAALQMAENKLSTKKRLGYSFVMTNYAALGDKNGVLRLWEFSKRVAGKIPCANYMSVMICLVKLGDISEAERIFKAWESQCWKYDIRVPNILLGAHMRNGCMDKAELLFFHALKKGGNPNYKTWEILMEGWVKKKEMDKAVEAMKKGLSMLKHCIWRPPSDILSAIAEYYEEIQNVDDGNRFVKVLRRSCLMNLHLYKSFVRMHVKAKRVTPNIAKMMARDGIEPDEEIKLLIQQMTSISSSDIYVD